MLYYLNVFLIYSIFGYISETLLKTFVFHTMNNGIMYGPWVPVYGFGSCIIIFLMRFIFNHIKVNRLSKIFLLFLCSMFILTLLEFIGGHLIELISGEVFWSYEKLKYNFGHYIALEISLFWGIISLVVVYFIKPVVDKMIKKIPSIVTYLVLFIFMIDLVFTFISMK